MAEINFAELPFPCQPGNGRQPCHSHKLELGSHIFIVVISLNNHYIESSLTTVWRMLFISGQPDG